MAPGEVLVMRDVRCGCGKKLARALLVEGTLEIVCPKCKMVTTVHREAPDAPSR